MKKTISEVQNKTLEVKQNKNKLTTTTRNIVQVQHKTALKVTWNWKILNKFYTVKKGS